MNMNLLLILSACLFVPISCLAQGHTTSYIQENTKTLFIETPLICFNQDTLNKANAFARWVYDARLDNVFLLFVLYITVQKDDAIIELGTDVLITLDDSQQIDGYSMFDETPISDTLNGGKYVLNVGTSLLPKDIYLMSNSYINHIYIDSKPNPISIAPSKQCALKIKNSVFDLFTYIQGMKKTSMLG
ncbi:MAG: hypothetical protein R2787_09185 [Saprospiraceae bacterium]